MRDDNDPHRQIAQELRITVFGPVRSVQSWRHSQTNCLFVLMQEYKLLLQAASGRETTVCAATKKQSWRFLQVVESAESRQNLPESEWLLQLWGCSK